MTAQPTTEAPTYNGLRVRKVRVTATVAFDAYISADCEDDGPRTVEQRIAWELSDAIEYRAPHLTDSEEGDALIALTDGGSSHAAIVDVLSIEDLPGDFDSADVAQAAEATAAGI